MQGWRINTVFPDGTIAGFPPHRYPWTPAATCVNGHLAPHPPCACGHHLTPNKAALLEYARVVDLYAPARAWGTYEDSRTHPDDGTTRILVYAETAGTVHGRRSWDPLTTVRATGLRILAAHLPHNARHLADPIGEQYPHLPIHEADILTV